MEINKALTGLALAACAVTVTPTLAADAAYPERTITMLIGFAPGGGSDTVGRLIAHSMSNTLGVPIVVENKAGASGSIASQVLARAKPDGYTIMLSTISSLSVNQHMGISLGYDPAKDFSFISTAVSLPNALVVNAQSEIKTLDQLEKMARAGKISYGSSGMGGGGHLAGELYKNMLGIKDEFPHVPYRGGALAMNDLLGNNVPALFATIMETVHQSKAGKVRALAVTGRSRAPQLPDIPTLDEAGLKGFEMTNWYGFIAPAGTSPDIVDKLNAAIRTALKDQKVTEFLDSAGMEAFPSSPTEMEAFVLKESNKWGDLIQRANIKP